MEPVAVGDIFHVCDIPVGVSSTGTSSRRVLESVPSMCFQLDAIMQVPDTWPPRPIFLHYFY